MTHPTAHILHTSDENILIEGVTYATTLAAARACNITREHVARLCKEGKADAKLINGQWFVSVPSLTTHLALQKLALAEQRRVRAQVLRTEYRRHTRPYAHRAIQTANILWSHRILASLAIVSIFYTSTIFISGLNQPTVANAATTVTFLTSGTSYSVPSDWNSSNNTIEVIGGGAGGGGHGGGGYHAAGGGGAYSKITNLTLSGSATYAIGSGGSGGASGNNGSNGGDTYFNAASCAAASVCAKGGQASTGTTGGPGGAAASGIGTTKYSGGAGADHSFGGGGGAAGKNGNGNPGNSSNGTGGSGDAGFGGAGGTAGALGIGDGGPGGNGTEWDASHGSGGGGGGGANTDASAEGTNGGAGGLYGGGGGAGGDYLSIFSSGGAGKQGLIVITYTPATTASGATFMLGMPF